MLTESRFQFFCRAVTDLGVKHVILRQDGREIFSNHWEEEVPVLQYSVAKSVCGTAVGFALEEGLFSLDDPVIDYFEEDLPGYLTPELKSLKIRHLLTMQMGHQAQYLMGYQRKTMKETDWVKFVLSRPMKEMPGTGFRYSNAGPYLAGVLMERLTGQKLADYLMPRLFEPLGIERPQWDEDPMGQTFAAGGLWLKTSDLAKFGQTYLDQGMWQGNRVIPRSWIRTVDRTTILTTEEQQNYSMLFWRSRHDSISAVGRHGQYCTIVPEKNLVIAMNGFNEQDDNLLEYVWTYLYPSL